MDEKGFGAELTLREGFAFDVEFGQDGVPALRVDEPPPLGAGGGPNPSRLLAAAVGNCMAASLLFCLQRSRVEVSGLRATVEGTMVRNERGRLRVGGIRVRLAPEVPVEQVERLGRCGELFEDFCIIGQSVRQGIDVSVEVEPVPVLPPTVPVPPDLTGVPA